MTSSRRRTEAASRARLGRPPVFIAASGLAVLLMVAGCSGSKTPAAVPATSAVTASASASPSVAASPTPSHPVPPTPLAYAPADPDHIGNWVVILPYQAATPQARQVLADWTVYEQTSFQVLNLRRMETKDLDRIATGNTRLAIMNMVWQRIQGTVGGRHVTGGLFTVGQATHAVRDITVKGKNATVEFCADDQSYEVDTHGATVIPAPGIALIREKLIQVKGKWLASDQPVFTPGGCVMPKATS
jgi:hypothetical protein